MVRLLINTKKRPDQHTVEFLTQVRDLERSEDMYERFWNPGLRQQNVHGESRVEMMLMLRSHLGGQWALGVGWNE